MQETGGWGCGGSEVRTKALLNLMFVMLPCPGGRREGQARGVRQSQNWDALGGDFLACVENRGSYLKPSMVHTLRYLNHPSDGVALSETTLDKPTAHAWGHIYHLLINWLEYVSRGVLHGPKAVQ